MNRPSQIAALDVCPNCDAKLAGSYCYDCGQKDIGERLNSKILLSNAFEALTEMDSKVWRTLRELTLRPGQVALNYIAGERARYINPIKYFITIFTVYLTVLIISGGLEAEIKESINISPDALVDEQSMPVRIARALEGILREYRNLITFLAIPIFAFSLRWQFWRSRRNYAETLSFVCFLSAHAHLMAIPIALLQWWTGVFSQGPRGLLMAVFFIFGSKVFYNMGVIKAILATLVAMTFYTLASFISGTFLISLRMFGIL